MYPAWDGAGSLFGPPSIVNPYGWAHSTTMASWTGWTVSGDFNFDIGAVAIDRAAGFLTGWFGWAYGGDCNFATTTNYNSASYPAESCSATLHTGADMYIWGGTFNSCPNTNRLGLNTTGGCLGAVWGGMSGSGAYYFDANNNRFTHAITSTSNRSTYAEYTRQWLDWVNYLNGTFDPINAQGANFNLQPLNVVGPGTFTAGTSTGGLTHLAANTSTAARNTNYTFRVYLSSNDDVSSTDTLISTQSYGWNFGGVSAVTVNMGAVTIPANTPPGVYYLGVIYDNATDTNSGDNDSDGWDALRITVTSADVTVTALSAPAAVNPGQTFNVSNTVANNGNAATGSFRLGLYLSTRQRLHDGGHVHRQPGRVARQRRFERGEYVRHDSRRRDARRSVHLRDCGRYEHARRVQREQQHAVHGHQRPVSRPDRDPEGERLASDAAGRGDERTVQPHDHHPADVDDRHARLGTGPSSSTGRCSGSRRRARRRFLRRSCTGPRLSGRTSASSTSRCRTA